MSIPGYQLRLLRVIYTSRTVAEMDSTLQTLHRTLQASTVLSPMLLSKQHHPQLYRLPRRQLRVSIAKAMGSKDVVHHVFEDYRYSVSFFHLTHPNETLSSILGSMSGETNCRCQFQWSYSDTRMRKTNGETDLSSERLETHKTTAAARRHQRNKTIATRIEAIAAQRALQKTEKKMRVPLKIYNRLRGRAT